MISFHKYALNFLKKLLRGMTILKHGKVHEKFNFLKRPRNKFLVRLHGEYNILVKLCGNTT